MGSETLLCADPCRRVFQRRGVSTRNGGFPLEIAGFPLEIAGFPAKIAGSPLEIAGFPLEINGFPVDFQLVLRESKVVFLDDLIDFNKDKYYIFSR